SAANLPLLERLGGMMRVHPNDDIAKRVAEIAATLGSPVLSDLKLEGGDAIYDVVGLRDLFFGERLIVSGRYRGAGSKLAIAGRGYRREVDVAFPPKEEGNNYVRRLWAQRKVSDLLAKGPSTKAEVTELGVKHQIMTPYTSFLVLETEQMWKDHQLKREVQKQDEVLGKGPEDPATKREVIRKVAQLLELSYKAAEQQRFDRVIQLSDEILKIDPRYPVALELKEEAEKSRHKEEYFSVWARKLEALKRETRGDGEPMLPKATSMKIPSREEWGQLVNKLTPSVIKTEGGASDAADPEVIVKRLEPLVVKPAPEAKPEPPPIVPNPPAPPDTTTNSLVIRTTPRNGDEDPRAKAIREAYEEQLRRDRQEVTINLRKDAGGEVVNEFRRQSGWNFTLDDATGQLGPGSPLTGAVWSEDLDGGVDTYTPFMRMRGGQQAYEFGYGGHAKVHYTLDHDAYDNPVDPTEIGPRRPAPGMDFFAPTLKVGQTLLDDSGGRTSGKAARINDYQRLLDQANTATAKYEADMQVFVRQGEVQLAQIQDLTKNVEEHRSKLAKSINEKSLKVDELHYARLMAERLQEDLARLEAKHAELARDSKMLDKKVTDDVSSLMVCVVAGTVMEVVTVSEDGSSITLKGAAVTPGQICAVTRAGSFVALVRVEQIGARVWQGLAVGRILPGDRADVVASPRTYLATLPEAVRLDLSSRAGQQAIRAKMGW
ncbi:MAG: hypothetical protein HY293_18435, partial [Planctomycetes bacterium]|nr:hypothetical protein [Planctomycetota bacterium]